MWLVHLTLHNVQRQFIIQIESNMHLNAIDTFVNVYL